MNKWIAGLATMVMAAGFASAALASTVKYDFDRTMDFSKWRTVAWSAPEAALTTLPERRIQRALEDGFKAKGYTLVATPAQADFVIAYHAGAWRDVQVDNRFYGPGFGRQVRVDRIPMGVLVVDVFERSTGKLAWRGSVTDALADNPEQAEKKTAKAVARLLKSFPARVQP